MSEPKGPFDAARRCRLASWVKSLPRKGRGLSLVIKELRREYLCTDEDGRLVEPCPCEDYEGCLAKPFIQAIRVLEDWPKWEPLIEAAGKVDKGRAIRTLATLLLVYTESEGRIIPALEKALKDGAVREIRALLEALPEEEET